MKLKEFRFAVGKPKDLRSSVWKVWTHKNDAYVLSRMMGSDMKVSLHESGKCQWSLTSEWLKKHKTINLDYFNRHIVKWKRGVLEPTQALHILRVIIPSSELRCIEVKENLKDVYWIPNLGIDYATIIECYFSPPLSSQPKNFSVSFDHLTSLPLDNSMWFVLFFHSVIVTPSNLSTLKTARKKVIKLVKSEGLTLKPTYRALGFASNKDEVKSLIEIVPYDPGSQRKYRT